MSSISPSIKRRAFSCPHCAAHAQQTWYSVFADLCSTPTKTPDVFGSGGIADSLIKVDPSPRGSALRNGEIVLEHGNKFSGVTALLNLNLSRCGACYKFAVWRGTAFVDPPARLGELPNVDLDPEIQDDINEARAILDVSPRGAAALLRLAVQKLCKQLGESGKDINKDIQSLVSKGLDPHLQQAFDFVRVVGNESVHPGTLDIKDDRETALALIELINIVATQLISQKKKIAALYQKLPAEKLKGIESRAKASTKK